MRKLWNRQESSLKILILFTLTLLFRLYFAVHVGLADDESYHWSWTKNLQLSYFDHPAMIAWLEYISTFFLGETKLAIRLPSLICFTSLVVLLYKLTKDIFNPKAALFVGLVLLWSPFWGFGGHVASPETPFMLCWVAAAAVFWQGIREDERQWSLKKTWISLGILMGLGLNSKFIIALLAPGFGLYLLMTPNRRKDLLTPWPWVGFLIATLLCSPIFVWNTLHDWPGFKYQFHDRHAGGSLNFERWMLFFAAQLLFYTPFLYFLILLTFINSFIKRADIRWRYLFCLSAPSFAVFYIQALFAEYKPHWSGAAVTLLLMGAGAIWSEGLSWGSKQIVKEKSQLFKNGILAFFIPLALLCYTPIAYPWIPKAFHILKPNEPWKTSYDFSNEFTGWEELGEFVNRRQREIHAESGKRPFIASHRYETTAQTTWATKQKVYMLNTTPSQYTVMQTPAEMQNLIGEDALFVCPEKYNVDPNKWAYWDNCTTEELKTFRKEIHARTFYVSYCRNFKGIIP